MACTASKLKTSDQLLCIFNAGLLTNELLQELEAKTERFPAADDEFDMFGEDLGQQNGKHLPS